LRCSDAAARRPYHFVLTFATQDEANRSIC
jgi:hypothetical protein